MKLDTGRNNWVVIGAGIVLLVVAGAAVAAFTRGGSTGSPSAPSATAVAYDAREVSVDVVDNKYEPPVIRIKPGTTVTWLFKGKVPHTVTSESAGAEFDSGVKTKGDFAYTFDTAGVYDYRCRVHPTMVGRVVVE
jgi:plastocyanin